MTDTTESVITSENSPEYAEEVVSESRMLSSEDAHSEIDRVKFEKELDEQVPFVSGIDGKKKEKKKEKSKKEIEEEEREKMQ